MIPPIKWSYTLREDWKIIKLLKGFLKNFSKEKPASSTIQPLIIPRAEHNISRNQISNNALKVLYRLHNAGFSAYLVGGCVRDILLGKHPKDFDIATNALPEEVRKLFRNCRLIGKRFRLAHIVFGKEIIEVATFRTHHKDAHAQQGHSHEGMIIRDNVYGSIEDDAWRRDFSVNALYYNIADYSVVDYTGGMADLNDRLLKMIGNPEQRFHEDPVRLLRIMRFAGKLGLNISPETEAPIVQLSHLLLHVSSARLYQEVLKFFQEGATYPTFKLLQDYRMFEKLFPQTAACLSQDSTKKLLETALRGTDERWQEGKSVSPAFLFAVFLWHPINQELTQHQNAELPTHVIYDKAIKTVLREQTKALAIPRALLQAVHDICFLQYRLTCRYGSAPYRLLDHPRFRAAYDLLILREAAGEPMGELHNWWVRFYSGTHEQREALIKEITSASPRKRKRNKRRRKPNTNTKNHTGL